MFEKPIGSQGATGEFKVGAFQFRLELRERKAGYSVRSEDSWRRHLHEVAMSVDSHLSPAENRRRGTERRRISSSGRVDIANIIGRQIDVHQVKRAAGILVDIADRSVRDLEAVYFERIDLLEAIGLLAERDLVGALSAKLRQVEVNFGPR